MTPELKRVSSHVDELRWLQRSDDRVMDPLDAWADATPLRIHELEGDEVRFHAHTGTLLVRKNTTLVTVIDVDEQNWIDRRAAEYLGGEQA